MISVPFVQFGPFEVTSADFFRPPPPEYTVMGFRIMENPGVPWDEAWVASAGRALAVFRTWTPEAPCFPPVPGTPEFAALVRK